MAVVVVPSVRKNWPMRQKLEHFTCLNNIAKYANPLATFE